MSFDARDYAHERRAYLEGLKRFEEAAARTRRRATRPQTLPQDDLLAERQERAESHVKAMRARGDYHPPREEN